MAVDNRKIAQKTTGSRDRLRWSAAVPSTLHVKGASGEGSRVREEALGGGDQSGSSPF
jgi:hypothetical protein